MPLLSLNLPKESIYKQFIPKKQFYNHGNFNQTEKNIFIHGIERITLYAQLTRDNTNLDPYKDETKTYEEISIFLVELRIKDDIEKIASLIMESIPYPVILIGKYDEQYNFYGAHQRDNKVDEQKIILERMHQTGFVNSNTTFINQINYKNLSKTNLFTFYDEYIQAIIRLNLESRNIKATGDNAEILKEIERLEEKIILLKNKIKRENHFNKKMELNMKIKRIENKLQQMEE